MASERSRPFPPGSCAFALLDMLAKQFPSGAEGSFQASSALKSLCDTLFWNIAASLPDSLLSAEFKSCGQDESFRSAAADFFRQALRGGFNAKAMASAFGISVRSLEYKCKAALGLSPADAFASYRIGEAVSLLEAGSSVKEAASALGFSDQFHLSKAFKRKVGFPPSHLLRKGKGS
jgi:AraC-like DNA-binding protein